MKSILIVLTLVTLASCSSTPTSTHQLISTTHLKMKMPLPIAGKTASAQNIFLGGFSGLQFNQSKDGEYFFSTITDRGPNGYNIGAERPFLVPEFSPQIIGLKTNLKDGTFEVTETLKLKRKDGTPLTGLPNIRTEENPIDIFGMMISLDKDGLDTESLVSDDEGGFWIGEEYAPSLVHVDSNGKVLRRLTPYNELPKIYSERKPNRGFEGIAKDKNKIFGFLQSPIPTDEGFSRIVEVDLDSMKTSGEYFYQFDKGFDKIGDAVSLGNGKFLVVELNGKKGDQSKKLIYKITLNGIDNQVKKELLVDLGHTSFSKLEKVEGLALINSRKIAIVNDNDFQIDTKTDPKTGITPLNSDNNELLILEFAEDI